MGILDALRSMMPAEVIGGVSLDEVVGMVDLDIEFTPVVAYPVSDDHLMHQCPTTAEVQKWGDGYALVYPEQRDFSRVTHDDVKRMRARFLLARDFYYRHLRGMSHSMRDRVVLVFFPGGVWQPAEGSDLSKAMGLE